jgi:hypothetical protein
MDFNRGGQFRPNSTPAAAGTGKSNTDAGDSHTPNAKKVFKDTSKWVRWCYVALLISGTVLFISLIFFFVFGTHIDRESKYVESDKYQAVFVNVNGTNGGQVYFGRIASLTPTYIRLTNVFYIQNQQTDTTKSSSAYNLVKLGCELHGPTDEMLINRNEVFFWENLKTDSQVAQKATEFFKQNPNGQKCDTTSNSTQQSSTTGTGTGTGASTTGTNSTASDSSKTTQ